MPYLNRLRAGKIVDKELAVRCADAPAHLDGAGYSLIDFDTMDLSQSRAFRIRRRPLSDGLQLRRSRSRCRTSASSRSTSEAISRS
jgi:hypothetical protein